MVKSTVRNDEPYPIPLDTLVPITLLSVEEVEVPFTYRQGPKAGTSSSFKKWEWNTQVHDGEYAGIDVRGSSEPKITNAESQSGLLPLALPFVEAFLGRSLELGEEVDTDLLVGLYAQATVKHLEPRAKRDGDGFWFNIEVDEIFPMNPTNGTRATSAPPVPVSAGGQFGGGQLDIPDEPPF